jgi:hypothetical protein
LRSTMPPRDHALGKRCNYLLRQTCREVVECPSSRHAGVAMADALTPIEISLNDEITDRRKAILEPDRSRNRRLR